MSFDESGYILYPRTSQTQQVPAYNVQVSTPRLALFSPKYPFSRMAFQIAVRRDTPMTLRLSPKVWLILSETDERFNIVRGERIQPQTRHLPRSALELYVALL